MAVRGFAEALAKAWNEYNNISVVVMVVVQKEECNVYDQHWLAAVLKEKHGVLTIRKNLSEIEAQAQVLPDGTLSIMPTAIVLECRDGQTVAVIYFRVGYSLNDYPSETEWRARLFNGKIISHQVSINLISFSWNKEDSARTSQTKCVGKVPR